MSQQTLSYSFDGKRAGTLTGNLANTYLANSQFAYFGFTGATGGLTNLQQVEINKFDAVLEDGTEVHFGEPQPPPACPVDGRRRDLERKRQLRCREQHFHPGAGRPAQTWRVHVQ